MSNNVTARETRARLGPGAPVGISEETIQRLVHAFYARVRQDPVLGPIFEAAIGDRWDAHLAKLCDFWSSVLLMTGRFKGAPMAVHARQSQIQPEHFDRWLQLFALTAVEVCEPSAAAMFIEKAHMIGESLRLGLAAVRGTLIAELTQDRSAGRCGSAPNDNLGPSAIGSLSPATGGSPR